MLSANWDSETSARPATVSLAKFLSGDASSRTPKNLADILRLLESKAGVIANGLGVPDVIRSPASYQKFFFGEPAGYYLGVTTLEKKQIPASFLFPCEVLNRTDGVFRPPTENTPFLVGSIFCRSLLRSAHAEGFSDFLTKRIGSEPMPKPFDFGVHDDVDWIRFCRTYWPESSAKATNTPMRPPPKPNASTPSRTPGRRPPAANRPYNLNEDGVPFIPLFDCSKKDFDLKELQKNKRLAHLLPGDFVLVSATVKLDSNGDVSFVPTFVVLFERNEDENGNVDRVVFGKKDVVAKEDEW
ncbi:hypothetical protein BDR26DRAFT_935310 [Obelidium mucronatum]|nr:hypothetical protein BDR26DRAFT_935310 [Obelidium mucronatum]